ncbi:MAG: hypothetical protein VW715_06695 [Rhodospirillales bacterium]
MSGYTNTIIAVGATSGAVTYYLTKDIMKAAMFGGASAVGFMVLVNFF